MVIELIDKLRRCALWKSSKLTRINAQGNVNNQVAFRG